MIMHHRWKISQKPRHSDNRPQIRVHRLGRLAWTWQYTSIYRPACMPWCRRAERGIQFGWWRWIGLGWRQSVRRVRLKAEVTTGR